MQYQVLCHIHRNDSHFLAVFTDHLLNDAGEVIVLGFFDDVQQLLHHRLDEGSDVDLSCTHTIHKRQKEERIMQVLDRQTADFDLNRLIQLFPKPITESKLI